MAQNRVKSAKPEVIKIADWPQADQLVKQIGDLQLQVSESQASAKGRIDKIKEALAADVIRRQDAINLYCRSLEAFAAEHEVDFADQKSKQLNFGKLGWRKSTFIIIKNNTLDLIKRLFSPAKAAICIRTKETVDKEALAKLTDEQLTNISARRKITEVFFVEPDLPEAASYEK
jgi:phage host-nuclease inhibitor protein Gam